MRRKRPFQFGDGRGDRPTIIGVGERRGVGSGVNAGRGVVAADVGVDDEATGGDGAGVDAAVGGGTTALLGSA